MIKYSSELKDLLELKSSFYNRPEFISSDPISIPHMFTLKEDIEIAGFLSAVIAWGQRGTIIRNAKKLLEMMDSSPLDFILNAGEKDMKGFLQFSHRTFNGTDTLYFINSLQNIYLNYGGLEKAFSDGGKIRNAKEMILHFRNIFFEIPFPVRTSKHIANPAKGFSAKRLNMFLRWMVRNDGKGVDFGIWKSISPAALYCPLDVHSGRVARKLGLLQRKQDDWKAVEELTASLRQFEPEDPVKYDFALFGMGVFEKF
jgi:uncharacterized protein (TIGR02757 family)